MVRRVLIACRIGVVVALMALANCTPPAADACLDEGDCFGGEVCVEERCRRVIPSAPDAGEAGCDAADDAPCVVCVVNGDCASPAAPLCVEGECVGCVEDADCLHVDGLPVCFDGACVACTIDDDEACMGHGCDVRDHTCSEWPKESRLDCERCTADSECTRSDFRCVPMVFDGNSLADGYCQQSAFVACQRPFPSVIRRESLSGEPLADYCAPYEDRTTCAALEDFGQRCDASTDCGLPQIEDGVCGEFARFGGTARYCSYRCISDADCFVGGTACVDDEYCQHVD